MNKKKVIYLLFLLMFLCYQLKSQSRFYNSFGMSATIGLTGFIYQSFGYKISQSERYDHFIGVYFPISYFQEYHFGVNYNFDYKVFRKIKIILNSDIKIGFGDIAYKIEPSPTLAPELSFNPLGLIFMENIKIPIGPFYLKFGYGFKYSTNFGNSYFNKNQVELCAGYNFHL